MAPSEDSCLESGLLTGSTEKTRIGNGAPEPEERLHQKSSRNKSPIRKTLLILGVGLVLGLGVFSTQPTLMHCGNKSSNTDTKAVSTNGDGSIVFEDLRKISPNALHRLLHKYFPDRYQHGVYASDHEAIKALSQDSPDVAAVIIEIAKRQDTNNNSSTPSLPPTLPPTKQNPPTPIPPTISLPTSAPSVPTSPPSIPATPTQSSSVSSPPPSSSDNTTPSAPPTSTDSASETSPRGTSDAPTQSNTDSPTSGPTDTPTQTSPPSKETITRGTKSTSSPVPVVFTHTLPNGGTTTLTSTSWVAVVPTDKSSSNSKAPGLQNAAPRAQVMLPAVLGLMAGAVLMV